MKNIDLQEIRGQLDEIDKGILELFLRRMEVCGQVAEYKYETGKAVYDGEREKSKLNQLCASQEDMFFCQSVEDLFTQIMTISRRYQYKILAEKGRKPSLHFQCIDQLTTDHCRVVYQGVEGAYSHAATLQFFGPEADVFHVPTWEDAMLAVQEERADYAVIPIENSSAGAVVDAYDLLIRYPNFIVAEIFLPISHALLGLPGTSEAEIKTVISHPQALMQCSDYLNSHRDWKQISVANTAMAASQIREGKDPSMAAVASETAGYLYGLKTLKTPINNNPDNTTRFLVLSRNSVYLKEASRVSICFELPHKSGSLYNLLGNFIYNGVNLLKIESRPIQGKNWEYRFYADLAGNLDDEGIINALTGVEQEATMLRILGNY